MKPLSRTPAHFPAYIIRSSSETEGRKVGTEMGITNSNKELDSQSIECGGSFKVKLSITAEPDIISNPADIVLILDRSRSMAGASLANLKNGAKKFIDIIYDATRGDTEGQIGFGSHIGIVSFATEATKDTSLITSVEELKSAVDALSAEGSTNHEDAFIKASELFDLTSSNEKIMVMFTDGKTTTGGDANVPASAAKAQGVVIYCIGLEGNGGIDVQAMSDWASDPDSAYVAISPSDEELEKIFEDLAKNITKPGARDIVITDTVSPCFKITSLSSPDKGTASLIDNRTAEWKIDELGVSKSEGAFLEFTVRHVGDCSGTTEVNESIEYEDKDGNTVNFPSPTIEIDCGGVVTPESCPKPVEFTADSCDDSIEFDAGDIYLDSLGRIIQIDVTLRNVCPNKRVALAVILNETDKCGKEYKRGLKTLTIPAHTREGCRDITVRCIKFVLPEDIDVAGGERTLCSSRRFNVRFIANYIDNGFDCCDKT